MNTALVIAGVTVCAAPRWPRKRPALLDRPLSIVAAPGLTNLQAGGVGVGGGIDGAGFNPVLKQRSFSCNHWR